MEEEKNPPTKTEDFGKVVDALHTKSKLSTLRTYQGDVADFIKNKNKSTISIALEEKHKKEEEGEAIQETTKTPRSTKNLSANFTALALSITLIIAGVLASIFTFSYITKSKKPDVSLKTEIIPYNNEIVLANQTKESLATEIKLIPTQNGINIIEISDNQGNPIDNATSLFNFLNIKGKTIVRYFNKGFVLGTNGEDGLFLIFETSDFGGVFSGMLEWEKDLDKDLSFMINQENLAENNNFIWRDIIIRNKDARVLSNNIGVSKVYYSFLDRNTVVITNNEKALTDIFSSFASRPFVR